MISTKGIAMMHLTEMIADGRDWDWHHPDVTRMVIRDLRSSGDFEDIPCPYTPKYLVMEMVRRLGNVTGKRALVIYTVEIALALSEAGCENVTLATQSKNELTAQLASDIGCRYMLLPCGGSAGGSVMAIEPGTKFDIVIGNPPYQASGGTGNPIWQEFVRLALDALDEGGKIAMIHPPAWRAVGRTNSNAMAEIRGSLKSLDMLYLSMTSKKDCGKVFEGKTTPFDVYVALKSDTPEFKTEIRGTDGVKFDACIKEMDFVPNFLCNDLDRVLAKGDEDRVDFLYSSSAYEARRPWMSKYEHGDFVHPCVFTVSSDEARRKSNGGG